LFKVKDVPTKFQAEQVAFEVSLNPQVMHPVGHAFNQSSKDLTPQAYCVASLLSEEVNTMVAEVAV